jgi:hypothetical protein
VLSPANGVALHAGGHARNIASQIQVNRPAQTDAKTGKRASPIVPGAHYGLFAITYSNLVEIASWESAPAELYDLMLEQRDWSAKSKQRALGELLSVAPVRVEA